MRVDLTLLLSCLLVAGPATALPVVSMESPEPSCQLIKDSSRPPYVTVHPECVFDFECAIITVRLQPLGVTIDPSCLTT